MAPQNVFDHCTQRLGVFVVGLVGLGFFINCKNGWGEIL